MSKRKPIDGLVEALFREGADQILIESGKPVRICAGTAERDLLAQPIRTEQIESLLKEFSHEDEKTALLFHGTFNVNYQNRFGAVKINCKRKGDALRVKITPSEDQDSRESPVTEAAPPPQSQTTTRHKQAKVRNVTGVARDSAPVPQKYIDPDKPLNISLESIDPPRLPSKAMIPVSGTSEPSDDIVIEPLSDKQTKESTPPSPIEEIDPLLIAMVEQGGSDLHLTSGFPPYVRIRGLMGPLAGYDKSLTSEQIYSWLSKIAPDHVIPEFERELEADYGYELAGYCRYRINLYRDHRGVATAIRSIPCEIKTIEELGLPEAALALCELEQGLVLVTGATGSGKSTTLAALIDHINRNRQVHIITVEDPIEFIHMPKRALINQRELNVDTRSFPNALRSALREDPDVILVGEMRDQETIMTALEMADTGHLVFGTLHTRGAVSTVDRVVEQFEAGRQAQVRSSIAQSLRGVISQTLCQKVGGGRVAAFEILLGAPSVANLIREGKTFQLLSTLQTSRGMGMQTMNDHLLQLVNRGEVHPEEALRRSTNQAELKKSLPG